MKKKIRLSSKYLHLVSWKGYIRTYIFDTLLIASSDKIPFQAPPDFHFVSAETKYTEQGRKAKKYKVVDKAHEDKPLTYEAFLTKLETNDDFLEDFVDVLRRGLQSFSDMDMTPYFFETPPVTSETLNSTEFEFVLVAAREFNQAAPSPG